MRIVDVCEFYSPTGGGVRSYIEQKFAAADRHGHALTVVAPGAETHTEARGGGKLVWIKAPYLPVDRNYRMFWHAADVWRALDNEVPDIVEGSSPWRGGWIAGQWPGRAARVLFMHSDPIASYPQSLFGARFGRENVDRAFGWFWSYLRWLNAHFDATVATGEWIGERFAQFGLGGMEVVPLGIDRAAFGPDRRDQSLRRTLLEKCGLDDNAALLIAIGRHHPEKRYDLLIEAVARAQATRPMGLVIVGDGLIRRHVERWARQRRHIHVAGAVTDRPLLAAMVASADALLHGASSETFGLSVAEALCSGTPVVVPDLGGAHDLSGPGYAEVFRAGDRADVARAILALLARDRAQLSCAALDAAATRVSTVDEHFERLFGLYERLVAGKAQRVPIAA